MSPNWAVAIDKNPPNKIAKSPLKNTNSSEENWTNPGLETKESTQGQEIFF